MFDNLPNLYISVILEMTPEEVQELLRLLGSCESSGSSQARTQSSSSDRVGNTLEPYQTVKSSSKIMIRKNSCSGPGGIRTHKFYGGLRFMRDSWRIKIFTFTRPDV